MFKLPDGTTHSAFFRQNQRLGDIVSVLWPNGKTELDQDKNIGELGLKNDDVVKVGRDSKSFWPFRR